MKLLDLTLDTPAANLALDEALLLQVENDAGAPEVLRLWESPANFVVLGRSSKIADEVNLSWCEQNGIPVLRRSSGGGTVVAGPGCLMYAVVLRYAGREQLRMLDQAHRFVMQKIQAAVAATGVSCSIEGISDLAVDGKKVSGNALRCMRNAFLYHGTLLYGMDPELVANCLGTPARQPDWRQQRGHSKFLTKLPVAAKSLKDSLILQWDADSELPGWPEISVHNLVTEKYSRSEWSTRH